MGLDYEEAGVDLDKEEKAISALARQVSFSRNESYRKIGPEGHFAGLMELEDKKLAISTDGVGTKLLVADKINEYESIGIDCVAMNVNDVLAVGAEPLAFVDYLAFEEPDEEIGKEIGKGIRKGVEEANVNVLGGETATLSEIIKNFDIAGTCVGITDEPILGDQICIGDKIVGIRSSGIHSNGLTLARKSIKKAGYDYQDNFNQKNSIGEELLKPTRIYVKVVLDVIEEFEIKGLAHITGGGLNNLKRLGDFKFEINNPLNPPEVFDFIQDCGDIKLEEMYNVFNMGIGFCLITNEESRVAERIEDHGFEPDVVGKVKKGSGVVVKTDEKTLRLNN